MPFRAPVTEITDYLTEKKDALTDSLTGFRDEVLLPAQATLADWTDLSPPHIAKRSVNSFCSSVAGEVSFHPTQQFYFQLIGCPRGMITSMLNTESEHSMPAHQPTLSAQELYTKLTSFKHETNTLFTLCQMYDVAALVVHQDQQSAAYEAFITLHDRLTGQQFSTGYFPGEMRGTIDRSLGSLITSINTFSDTPTVDKDSEAVVNAFEDVVNDLSKFNFVVLACSDRKPEGLWESATSWVKGQIGA